MKSYINIKQYIVSYGCLLLLFMSVSVTAQQDPASQLIGTWVLDEGPSFASIDATTQARMDSIPQVQSQLLTVYRGRKATFGSDGSYTVSLADGRSTTGSWQLTASGEIQLTDPAGNKTYQKIIGLNTNRLVLAPMTSGDFKSILKELHFVKR